MDRRRAYTRRWSSLGLCFLVVAIVLILIAPIEIAAQAVTLNLPLSGHRSLVMTGAFRSLDREEPEAAGTMMHELRLRVGREDAANDTYAQLLDLTIPLR
jgi:hypothetical protein